MALFGTSKKDKKPGTPERARTAVSGALAAHSIIRAPWFSEKAIIATEKGVYVFEVPKSATKAEIAAAIKEVFKVAPRQVRVVHVPAKRKTMRTRRGVGTRAARHKAYVYLAAGETIQFA